MLISVIVPIYNTEEYVRYTIEDICNQTYRDIEILLIDDGSTDESGNICDFCAENDSRIKVYHTENRGVSAARNLGIKNANGEYYYFLDSDDRIHPQILETLLHNAIEFNCDIIQANGIDFKDDEVVNDLNHERIENKGIVICSREQMCLGMMDGSIEAATIVQNKLFLSKLFDDNTLFAEGKIHEDDAITYKLYWKCRNIGLNNSILFYYRRKRPGSIMNAKYNINRLDIIQAEKERYEFFYHNHEKTLYEHALKCRYISALNCIESLAKSDIQDKEKYIYDIYTEIVKLYPSILECHSVNLRTRIRIIYKILKFRVSIVFIKQYY